MPKTKARRDQTKYQVLPPLDAETYAGLKANIAINGVQVPVVKDEKGYILDGFARAKIAKEIGYECPSVVVKGLTEEEKRSQVRALNLARRQLDNYAKRQIIATEIEENPDRSNRWIARSLGVHHGTVIAVRNELTSTGQVSQLGGLIGRDGKIRPAIGTIPSSDGKAHVSGFDEEEILRSAKEIRHQRIAEQGRLEVERQETARIKLNGKRTWALTDDSKVVRCDLLIADPPFGITDEPWEPKDVEAFNREWSKKWSGCGADFIVIYWCQERLWDGRQWFDQALQGYEFEQLLTWQANNNFGLKSPLAMKQSWYPILLYRKKRSGRRIIKDDKTWDTERHNLDCHVAPVPQTVYEGEDLKQHPCQKHVSTMRWLINALSEPGELVCSLFCGVAPCGVAAVQLGRRYRGIEKSAEYRRIAEGRIAAYKDLPESNDQDEDDHADRRTYYNFRLGKLRPKASDQETPPGLAQFLFETISPVYEVQTILDPCAGRCAMTKPWRGRRVVDFEIDRGKDFFLCPNRIECDLVLCNPPFSQADECVTGYQPERFLRRIVEVVPRRTPIVLITPMGMRLHQEKRSKRWRWLRDEAPAISSIISLPRDAFTSVDFHVEILLFNMPRLKPHYFLPDRYV